MEIRGVRGGGKEERHAYGRCTSQIKQITDNRHVVRQILCDDVEKMIKINWFSDHYCVLEE